MILLDFELGYGSHDDPVGITIDAIQEARQIAENEGRYLVFVAYICGTEKEKQSYTTAKKLLEENSVIVTNTNEQAATLAVNVCKEVQ